MKIQQIFPLQQGEYSESLHGIPDAGLKVLAHDQVELPLIEALGKAAPPGFHTLMGIQKYQVNGKFRA